MELTVFYQLIITITFVDSSMKIRGSKFGNVPNSRKLILLGHFVHLGHFVSLDILSLWAFCLFRHNVFWAFYPVGHFVVLGQNVFWAFSPWAFCHMWAFCHFGHFIIQSYLYYSTYFFLIFSSLCRCNVSIQKYYQLLHFHSVLYFH